MSAKGYSAGSLKRLHCIWNHFSRYSSENHFSMEQGIAFLKDAYEIEWSEFPPPMVRHKRRSLSAIRFLRDFARTGEISIHRQMKPEPVLPEQFAKVYNSFVIHMDASGFSKDYMRGTKRNICEWLCFLDECNVRQCEEITIEHVMRHIQNMRPNISVGTVRTVVGRIRSFCKHLYLYEFTRINLAFLIPSVRYYRLTQIPTTWAQKDISKILCAIDRTTSTGKRDFAIFLLAVSLGLRISDILNLQFSSMDWEHSCINICQVKTDELLTLSMSQEVGWAIIDYLKNGRPDTQSNYIFIRHCAPYQQFCINTNFHYQLLKYAELAEVALPSEKFHGIHSLRHTFAGNLLRNETPLYLIAELLGHKGSSATAAYLKIDIEQLKLCALNPEIMEVENEE